MKATKPLIIVQDTTNTKANVKKHKGSNNMHNVETHATT